jgi:hypothetical protein
MEEKREFFIQAGKLEDDDALLEELDELEALAAADELNSVEVGAGHIASSNPIGQAQIGSIKPKAV